jgi:hypothetical protein
MRALQEPFVQSAGPEEPRRPGAASPLDDLSPAVRVFRAVHVGIAAIELSCLGYIWFSAITRRRGPGVTLAAGTLGVEGVGLLIGRGNCPLGPYQRRLGDPVPMFELFLPKRAAKLAVPILAGVAVAGLAAVALRGPELDRRAPRKAYARALESVGVF